MIILITNLLLGVSSGVLKGGKTGKNGGYVVTQIRPKFKIFSLYGTPETTPSNKFVMRIIIFLVNLQFIFQGSQNL